MSVEGKVVKADATRRWLVLGCLALAAMISVVVFVWMQSYLQSQLQSFSADPEGTSANISFVTRILLVALAVGLIGFALYFGWLGLRVLRAGQFPPPGMKVIRDTPIRHGSAAKLTGVAALIYCAFLLAVGTFGAWRIDHGIQLMIRAVAPTLPAVDTAGPEQSDHELPT